MDSQESQPQVNGFGRTLLRRWGMIFRFLFIGAVALIGYGLIDPPSISDVPFSQITPNQLFRCMFAPALVIGCFSWFLSFPEPASYDHEPYAVWAKFGGWTVGIIAFIGFLFLNR